MHCALDTLGELAAGGIMDEMTSCALAILGVFLTPFAFFDGKYVLLGIC